MLKKIASLPIAVFAITAVAGAPALAHGHSDPAPAPAPSQSASPASPPAATSPAAAPLNNKPLYLSARLNGANEVPAAGGPAVGDSDGKATALVEVKGSRISFALRWKGVAAPTLGHIHEGKAGVNGAVKVPLFGSAMPAGVQAAAGAVTVTDPALATAIRKDPAGFYVNLHTAEFPGGAVRGQLKPVGHPANVLEVITGGPLRAFLDGSQEVPVANGPAAGDADGHASGFIRARGSKVSYAFTWVGIGAPTLGHLHEGGAGVNGAVKVPLFGTAVPSGIFAVAGEVTGVDAAVTTELQQKPRGFYLNLHTAEFPGGAVRGQLSRSRH